MAKKTVVYFTLLGVLIFGSAAEAGFLDGILDKLRTKEDNGQTSEESFRPGFLKPLSYGKSIGDIASGLKEALTVGITEAVSKVSVMDGYYSNDRIRIPMPDQLSKVKSLLGKFGQEHLVTQFERSMNHAAEAAAPMARDIFFTSIREMTFDDARRILNGDDTEGTDYLKDKTYSKIYDKFQPVVSSTMDKTFVTRNFKQMVNNFKTLPFVSEMVQPVELDEFVTGKALDGLFVMVGDEERKIREDPGARVTTLLQDVFGKK